MVHGGSSRSTNAFAALMTTKTKNFVHKEDEDEDEDEEEEAEAEAEDAKE